MNIIVRKLFVEYNVSNGVASNSYIKEAEDFAKKVLIPMIEQILLEKFGDNYSAHFSRLELNLDSKYLASFSELARISETELHAEITKHVEVKLRELSEAAVIEVLSPWQHLYFILESGYKHWTYSYSDQEAFESELRRSFISVMSDPTLSFQLANAFENSETHLALEGALSRMFLIFLTDELCSYYFSNYNNLFEKLKREVTESASGKKKSDSNYQQLYAELLRQGKGDVNSIVAENWMTLEVALNTKQPIAPLLLKLLKGHIKHADVIEVKNHGRDLSADTKLGFLNDDNADLTDLTKQVWHVPPIPRISTTGADELFTDNLGLILIAPFLPTLFARLGLLKDNSLSNVSKAVYAVQKLSGLEESYEQDMIMAKVLCGMHLNNGVEKSKTSKKIENEVTNLLKSAIQNWPAVGNSSIQTIQQTFLQRSGKMYFQSDARISLVIEKRTEDILLNYVPWTFKTVQLPWMNSLIITEWE
ncbi:MAG: hypothetical protein JST49_00570 [Bacteroidetes bacterium]|nr:hypothetical protein [Bacteroidota bacterium]